MELKGSFPSGRPHRLMVPPPGYKFVPNTPNVCGEVGCFDCYTIHCDRCESKDRRIVELELRNSEMARNIASLQERVFRAGEGSSVAGQDLVANHAPRESRDTGTTLPSGVPFACLESPVMYDPYLQKHYLATTYFTAQRHDH